MDRSIRDDKSVIMYEYLSNGLVFFLNVFLMRQSLNLICFVDNIFKINTQVDTNYILSQTL